MRNNQIQLPVWWLRPSMLALGAAVGSLILCSTISENAMYGMDYFTAVSISLFLVGALLFSAGAIVGESYAYTNSSQSNVGLSDDVLKISLGLSLFAYVVWFGQLVFKPDLLFSVFNTTVLEVRSELQLIPGVTSLTQCSIIYFGAYTYRLIADQRNVASWMRKGYVALLILSAIRAFLWSERLALLEALIVPIIAYFASPTQRRGGILIITFPLLAFFGVFVIFGFMEYFRSWGEKSSEYFGSLIQYLFDRFSLYYGTSINNAYGYLSLISDKDFAGSTFPLLTKFIYGETISIDGRNISGSGEYFLYTFASLEFNTFSGLIAPFADFGVFGGGLLLFFLGLFSGRVTRAFFSSSSLGVLYPFIIICVAELPRLFLFSGSHMIQVLIIYFSLLAYTKFRVLWS